MSFKDRPFAQRFAAMGDEAESVFEKTYPQGWVRAGLNRPPLLMHNLSAVARYTPDYLTSKGYVEVQGFGADQTPKFKTEKVEALLVWHHHIMRVDYFLWDSTNKRYGWVRLQDLARELRPHHVKEFPEGKQYFGVRADELPMATDWVSLK